MGYVGDRYVGGVDPNTVSIDWIEDVCPFVFDGNTNFKGGMNDTDGWHDAFNWCRANFGYSFIMHRFDPMDFDEAPEEADHPVRDRTWGAIAGDIYFREEAQAVLFQTIWGGRGLFIQRPRKA